jgi:hypothetical protein
MPDTAMPAISLALLLSSLTKARLTRSLPSFSVIAVRITNALLLNMSTMRGCTNIVLREPI